MRLITPQKASQCHPCCKNCRTNPSNNNNNNNNNSYYHNNKQKKLSSRTARRNDATRAIFSNEALDNPFAEGQSRWVAKGVYTHGPRAGQACVCKWFKSGQVFDKINFDMDIEAMQMALNIVREWNNREFINKVVKVNVPEVWSSEKQFGRWAGTKALQEPFIENYAKFNSNSGWADNSTQWYRVMQALSHFSYHISGGKYVLCDLQGGVYSNTVVLTDPVILSKNEKFGLTDLGSKGISTFFSRHKCNEFCKKNWATPSDRRCHFNPRQGTSIRTGAQHPVYTIRSLYPLTNI